MGEREGESTHSHAAQPRTTRHTADKSGPEADQQTAADAAKAKPKPKDGHWPGPALQTVWLAKGASTSTGTGGQDGKPRRSQVKKNAPTDIPKVPPGGRASRSPGAQPERKRSARAQRN